MGYSWPIISYIAEPKINTILSSRSWLRLASMCIGHKLQCFKSYMHGHYLPRLMVFLLLYLLETKKKKISIGNWTLIRACLQTLKSGWEMLILKVFRHNFLKKILLVN